MSSVRSIFRLRGCSDARRTPRAWAAAFLLGSLLQGAAGAEPSGRGELVDAGLASASPDAGSSLAAPDAGTVATDVPPWPGAPETAPAPGEAPQVVHEPAPIPPEAPPPSTVSEAPPAKIRETVVTASPETRTSGSIHVLGPRQLEREEQDDPHAVLRTVPGVYARGEDGFGLRPNLGLRGGNADRSKKVTLLEDGVLFGPAPYSAPAAYYFPLMTRMEGVRVLKGPAAIAHGPQTIGGSVDLITRGIPPEREWAVDVAGGEHLYGKLHGYAGYGGERWGLLIEGIHLRSDGFKSLDGGGDTGFVRNEWMVKASHRLSTRASAQQSLHLKLGYSDERADETYLGLTDADFRAAPLRRYAASALDHMDWWRTQVALSHRLELPRVTLETTAYRHDLDRSWRKLNRFRGAALADVLADPDSARNAVFYSVLTGAQDATTSAEALLIGPNHRVFVSQGLQSVARGRVQTGGVAHGLELGVRAHYDRIRRRHSEDAFLMRSGALVPEGSPTLVTADNREATYAFAVHALDALEWGPLTLTPGVRLELLRSESQDRQAGTVTPGSMEIALPGIGLHGRVTEALGLFAGVHRGFSPPAPGQDAAPEVSVNYEAGARWTRRRERVELIGFFNDYSNLTDVCTFSNGCLTDDLDRQFDAGRAHVWGLEAFAEKTWGAPGRLNFPMMLAYTLTRTRLLDSFASADPQLGNVVAGDELPYVPRHQLSASVGVETSRAGVHVRGTFIDAMREVAGQGEVPPGERTDRQLTIDAGASVRVFGAARLYLNVRNALDQRALVSRRPFGARPSAPRVISAGFKYVH